MRLMFQIKVTFINNLPLLINLRYIRNHLHDHARIILRLQVGTLLEDEVDDGLVVAFDVLFGVGFSIEPG